jgi:hypothetical protein
VDHSFEKHLEILDPFKILGLFNKGKIAKRQQQGLYWGQWNDVSKKKANILLSS